MGRVVIAVLLVLVWLVAAICVILEHPVDAKPPPPPPGTVTPWLTMTHIVKPTMTPTPVARIYFPWIARGCPACAMKGAGNE